MEAFKTTSPLKGDIGVMEDIQGSKERERERETYIYIYMYIHTHTHIYV